MLHYSIKQYCFKNRVTIRTRILNKKRSSQDYIVKKIFASRGVSSEVSLIVKCLGQNGPIDLFIIMIQSRHGSKFKNIFTKKFWDFSFNFFKIMFWVKKCFNILKLFKSNDFYVGICFNQYRTYIYYRHYLGSMDLKTLKIVCNLYLC